MSESQIFYWGNNQNQLLSSKTTKSITSPQTCTIKFDIVAISASEKHVSFITSEGNVYSYGVNLDGRLGVGGKSDLKTTNQNPIKVKLPEKAVKIKCGFSHTCVVLKNKDVYSWGLGDYGTLGIGEFKSKNTPAKVILPC